MESVWVDYTRALYENNMDAQGSGVTVFFGEKPVINGHKSASDTVSCLA